MNKTLLHEYYGICSVRLLDQIVEEMDIRPLQRAYSGTGRKPATPPRTMLKVMMYAAMERNYSSRAIRRAGQRDMNYIWLLNGAPAPSYHEIARFRSMRLSQCAEELFFQLVGKLKEYGEIKYELLLSNVSSHNALRIFEEALKERAFQDWLKYGEITKVQAEYLFCYIVSGGFAVIQQWYQGGFAESEEEIQKLLTEVITRGLYSFIHTKRYS